MRTDRVPLYLRGHHPYRERAVLGQRQESPGSNAYNKGDSYVLLSHWFKVSENQTDGLGDDLTLVPP